MSSIRQQLLHVLFIDIQEVRPIVEEKKKKLRSQPEVQQAICRRMTLQTSHVVQQSEGTDLMDVVVYI